MSPYPLIILIDLIKVEKTNELSFKHAIKNPFKMVILESNLYFF